MPNHDPLFVTMGMIIIDEIHYTSQPSVYDILGGAGTYGVVGARLFCKDQSQRIGWIVDKGRDFPDKVQEEIDSWNTGVIYRQNSSRLTTRGWNKYGENDYRAFKYTTDKLRIESRDLIECGLASSYSTHLICSPKRCLTLVNELKASREAACHPCTYIWEPVPDECRPDTFPVMLEALDHIHILSPNAEEAARFFGESEPLTKEGIEQLALRFADVMIAKTCQCLIIRCGVLGCLAVKINANKHQLKWYPAYHDPSHDDYRVIDPTGGGNTFVGGFAMGYVQSNGDLDIACMYGNIAAGLAIEQVGMPILSYSDDKKELWNCKSIEERIHLYTDRLRTAEHLSESN